jgi:hypothetical protein
VTEAACDVSVEREIVLEVGKSDRRRGKRMERRERAA